MRTATAQRAPARPLAVPGLMAWTAALVFGMATMGVYAEDVENTEPTGAPTLLPTVSPLPTAMPSPAPSQAPTVDLNKVSGWGLHCCDFLLFPIAPAAPGVSCPCLDALYTFDIQLPPSPAVSRRLRPV